MKKMYIFAIAFGLIAGLSSSYAEAKEYNFKMGRMIIKSEVRCIEGYKWLYSITSSNNVSVIQMTKNINIYNGLNQVAEIQRINIECGNK